MRRITALGAALGALFITATAQAQAHAGGAFGEQGQFILSANRLFGLFSYDQNNFTNNNTNPSTTVSQSGTSLGFFWGSNNLPATPLGGGGGVPSFYSVPRLGFDYTVIPNLTIGGDLIAWFTLGGNTSTSQGSNSQSTGNAGANAFGIAPRVGYILGMNELLAIWLRGGVSYYNANTSLADQGCVNSSGNDTTNINVFGLDLDPQLVISPVNHFAFTVGPVLDWGFAGGASSTTPNTPNCGNGNKSTSVGYNAVNFSIDAGLLGWF